MPQCSCGFSADYGRPWSTHIRQCPKAKVKRRRKEAPDPGTAPTVLVSMAIDAPLFIEGRSTMAIIPGVGPTPVEEESVDLKGNEELEYVSDAAMDISKVEHLVPLEKSLSPPPVYPSGRPRRKTRLPARFRDNPIPPPPVVELAPATYQWENTPSDITPDDAVPSVEPYTTTSNSFGLYRIYPAGKPSYTPDICLSLDDMADSPTFNTRGRTSQKYTTKTHGGSGGGGAVPGSADYSGPFSNQGSHSLMSWYHNYPTLSLASLNALVSDVILDPGFNRDDFVSFRAEKELGKLDHYAILKDGVVSPDTWSVDSVEISLPGTRHKFPSKSEAPTFTVEDVYNRNIIDVIGAALREPDAETFHLFPFELHWKPSNHEPSRRICLELYNSDEFVQAHLEVQGLAHKNNCQHEAVVIGLMLWSDSTQLTQFGSSYLWPIYLFFANQSKYARNKPSSSSSHHIAYIPKLTDSTFKSAYRDIFGTDPSNDIMTHSRRELVHAVYLLLMNKDFMHAYVYGCEFEFWDGIIRQWFPRWFIHATDYPEKSRIPLLGTDRDMRFREKNPRVDRPADVANAEKLLYEKGIALSNDSYNEILKFTSRVPTRSAFSIRLQEHGFDHHSVLAPDLMHESELGVWKALLTHLIRVCQAEKGDTVAELDRRYRAVPTFGRDTIRKFPKSVSAMSKLAARDFEDLLQCSTPVFEGLFPAKHNKIIMGVLFEMQTWHSLAKLRAHDVLDSLPDLKASTKRLGKSFREFAKVTCAAYETEELPSTIGRPESDEGQDYNYYDINMFVDRDMFMRYRGGGIGHREIWDALSVFRNDRDPIDLQMRAIAASNYQTAQHEEDSEEEFDVMQIEGAGGNLNDEEGDDEEYERVEIVQTVPNEEDVEGGEVLDEKEVGDELGAEDGEVEDNGFGGLAYAPL
ncbi:hypothetical protein EST38_g11122 [Candolleomyces aberdarensis]|uniref:Uncharacterized protein n=1 Tax=Candolleomyces aberdarensis TaxID=2316362 RepID=A0A4Q2D8F5_9AGAR|nr:hypothetical protein EST38_g11122 [Candolleomyces aberdarensis]